MGSRVLRGQRRLLSITKWKRTIDGVAWRGQTSSFSAGSGGRIESRVLDHLKKHYFEASKMQPPPKINPPKPFAVIKGSLDSSGPVLSRNYNQEEIKITVSRLADLGETDNGDDSNEENINQLFLIVVIAKGDKGPALQFLCDLYPDAMGIQSVSLTERENLSIRTMFLPKGYQGPDFRDLDRELQKAFRIYLEERGINEELFPFLQAWLYVKEHRHLMRWLKTVGTFISNQTVPGSS
ncbi:hypothetical protein SUGI_0612070 [Cryptomeria japonica]|uniref:uncharacterized protein At2g39795, mitochondrial n=1 Tax=Cryptomeria japonica TaxID=3369 RepID=UPI002414AF16|nr:uncharacterized protein At2g39795, mitochondrial [Cryptomeria japonica]GLJ30822.1 hypothetical protein SUGI_0612070 [Cryptomeria japonica]